MRILKETNVPVTLFPVTAFVDSKEMLWWDRVEYAILNTELAGVELGIEGKTYSFSFKGDAQKAKAITSLQELLKSVPNQSRLEAVRDLEGLTGSNLTIEEVSS